MGLTPVDKIANDWTKLLIVIVWLALAALAVTGTFRGVIGFIQFLNPPPDHTYAAKMAVDITWQENMLKFHLIALLASFVLWLLLKSVISTVFCADKIHGVKIKLLENSVVPVSYCIEGLKIWQMILVYLIPVASIYLVMFILCVITEGEGGFMTVLCFVSLFMVFDLELVLYILVLKIKDKASYIAINNHIYNITIYK